MLQGLQQRAGNAASMLRNIMKYLCSGKCVYLLTRSVFLEKHLLQNAFFALKNYGVLYFLQQVRNKLKTLYFSNIDERCLVAPQRLPDKDYAHLTGYLAGYDPAALPRRVAICVSSQGNAFMTEIALAIESGLLELSVEAVVLHESDAIDPGRFDWVLIVAPHEFFSLGTGERLLGKLGRADNLLMVNTEQRQSTWFNMAKYCFKKARAILDINYQTAIQLTNEGFLAYFFPIGHSAHYEGRRPPGPLPRHELFFHLPETARQSEYAYADRPIDVLFVGANSPRRGAFMAAHAGLFRDCETFFYMPESDVPLQKGDARCLGFEELIGLVRRSKILINIHQGENNYFEWQRIVSLGILQKTLVISETCNETPFVEPGRDYVDVPLENLAEQCLYFLAHPEEAESRAERAHARLCSTCRMSEVLGNVFTHCVGNKREFL